jgi:RHS repeat-associated protein
MYGVSQDVVQNRHSVRWEEYTSFNMPYQIKYGNLLDINNPTGTTSDRTLTFVYGPEHQRTRQRVQLSANAPAALQSGAGDTWYLNGEDSQGLSYEKEVKTNGITEHKHYLAAGGITFAMHVTRVGTLAAGNPSVPGSTQTSSLRYFHHDQLGSIAAISDEAGKVIERLAYDPWGKRRNTTGPSDTTDSLIGLSTDRGFTEHEHLDEMGIIHMNGRLYDPLIGRFMSADPFIQAPGNLQSYNRYAYVMNNPLNLTDPGGYSAWTRLRDKVIKPIAIAYIGYLTGGLASSAYLGSVLGGSSFVIGGSVGLTAGIIGGAAGGFAVGALSSGTLKGGLQGALTGGLFGGVGASFEAGSAASYGGHAAAGCISSAAGGGNCGSGATSALFGKFTSNQVEGIGGQDLSGDISRGIATAVAGGVGSVIAGGKFENGATTAAYGYLFNALASIARRVFIPIATAAYNRLITSQLTAIATEMAAAEVGLSVSGVALTANTVGKLGEAALENTFRMKGQTAIQVSDGSIRIVDALIGGIANEAKVGYVALDTFTKTQILKDAMLVAEGGAVKAAHWHFFPSPITGKVGASENVLDMLRANNIGYTIYGK